MPPTNDNVKMTTVSPEQKLIDAIAKNENAKENTKENKTEITASQSIPKPYTERLIDYVKEHCKSLLPKDMTAVSDAIMTFSFEQQNAKKEYTEEELSTISWGKYKGKKIEDIVKLDRKYILWLKKNESYLKKGQLELVEACLL